MLMKQIHSLLLVCLLLTGCGTAKSMEPASITEIVLSDDSIRVNGGEETKAVFTSRDIIYYEDRTSYDSGNPYGEGTPEERHSSEEADAHTVVNITQPGTYRVRGKLSKGQIRVDLGEDAGETPNAVVNLILDSADITCTVAPAILFLNVYECDEDASKKTAKAEVDTTNAGAKLILEGQNTVTGSHVAKIFKDKDGAKKLWKQDAAIYSYMSMNIDGPGSLALTADNEGLGSELHLTVNGGNISIESGNDGMNTNQDDVSVITINGGNIGISGGLGGEGDCIDSNGYLVIQGGHVLAFAHPVSDSGLDSSCGTFIHGGSVVAMGSTEDRIDGSSKQVTMNLQFAAPQNPRWEIVLTREDGTKIFDFQVADAYDRPYTGLILASDALKQGETYHLYIDGQKMDHANSVDFHMNHTVNTFSIVCAASS